MEHNMVTDDDTWDDAVVPTDTKHLSRRWMFVVYNWTEEDEHRICDLEDLCTILVVGCEICPTTGTPHLQGFVKFKQPVRFSWWKNQFPHAAIKRPRPEDPDLRMARYCRKNADGLGTLVDFGCPEVSSPVGHKRKREDAFQDCVRIFEEGGSMYDVFKAHPIFYSYNLKPLLIYRRHARRYKSDPNWEPETDTPSGHL